MAKTWDPKKLRRSAATCRERVVRSSYMVSRIPSIAKAALSVRRTRMSVSRSSETPSKARYSHWMGMRTESLAVRALSVSRSSAGGQSRRTNSYSSLSLVRRFLRRYSLSLRLTSSTAAPTRFLSDGTRSSPSTWVFWIIRSRGSLRISAW